MERKPYSERLYLNKNSTIKDDSKSSKFIGRVASGQVDLDKSDNNLSDLTFSYANVSSTTQVQQHVMERKAEEKPQPVNNIVSNYLSKQQSRY